MGCSSVVERCRFVLSGLCAFILERMHVVISDPEVVGSNPINSVARVAQWQSVRFIAEGLRVRVPSLALSTGGQIHVRFGAA